MDRLGYFLFGGGYFVSLFTYVLVVCSDINHSNGEY